MDDRSPVIGHRSSFFIALEGIEGSGKSTQVKLLAERIRAEGHDLVLVREPGGTDFAEQMRHFVLHHPFELTPAAELFLYQAARSDLTTRVIRPALQAGKVVLADRYELSTRCYQGAGRGLPADLVRSAIALATGGLQPDIYVVLDVPVESMRQRQRTEGKALDKLERADDGFHERVASAFRTATGPNVTHVDGTGPAERVAESIWRAVAPGLPAGHRSASPG